MYGQIISVDHMPQFMCITLRFYKNPMGEKDLDAHELFPVSDNGSNRF